MAEKGIIRMNHYKEIADRIKAADAVLIGASNGLSIAEGYNIFVMTSASRNILLTFRESMDSEVCCKGYLVISHPKGRDGVILAGWLITIHFIQSRVNLCRHYMSL